MDLTKLNSITLTVSKEQFWFIIKDSSRFIFRPINDYWSGILNKKEINYFIIKADSIHSSLYFCSQLCSFEKEPPGCPGMYCLFFHPPLFLSKVARDFIHKKYNIFFPSHEEFAKKFSKLNQEQDS